MGLKTSLNRDYVGKEYDAVVYEVTEEAVQNYAKAYGDNNYMYHCGAMAPPIFPVVYELPILERAWSDEGLHGGAEEARRNILMLVHGEHMMRFFAPIRPGDEITARAKIVGMEDKGSGEVVNFRVTSTNQRGERVTESDWSLFIRGIGSGKKTKSAAVQDGTALGELQLAFRNVIRVSEGITYNYAEASGDRNPIHIDEKVAKAAGLRGIIVHGLCTMAMTMKGLIDSYCAGNPSALTCMGVRFSSPVYPGDTLISDGWEMGVRDGKIILGFEVKRKSDGVKVIRGGYAEVAI